MNSTRILLTAFWLAAALCIVGAARPLLHSAEAPAVVAPAAIIDPRDAELEKLRGQVIQLSAAVRKLQEQRDAAYAQLLNMDVQKAINEATPASAGPAAQPTALNPTAK